MTHGRRTKQGSHRRSPKHLGGLSLCVLLFFGVPAARAQEKDATAERQAAVINLYNEVLAWADSLANDHGAHASSSGPPDLRRLLEIPAALDAEDYYLYQRDIQFFSSPVAPEAVQAARTRLDKAMKEEFRSVNKKFVAEFEEELLRVNKASLAGRSPGDLDLLLKELDRFQNENWRLHLVGTPASFATRLRELRRFVQQWQEYLYLKHARLNAEAAAKFAEIRHGGAIYPLTDADLVAASAPPTTSNPGASLSLANGTIQNLSLASIDQIHALALQIRERPGPSDLQEARVLAGIEHLDRLRYVVKIYPGAALANRRGPAGPRGPAASRSLGESRGPEESRRREWRGPAPNVSVRPVLQPLIDIVVTYALHFEFEPGLPNSKPESPASYLNEVCARAAAKQDWRLLYRALCALEDSRIVQTPEWVPIEKSALANFLIAQNQERAGLRAFAEVSYRAAMGTPSKYLTKDYLASQFAHLQASKPEAPAVSG